ncbi:MAG: DUF981 domain-containing protein [Candidatus Micrarchaeota archaeon]|nr:DUF981 domain-containing protein [Candidatus Micrarchaeota archaeon]
MSGEKTAFVDLLTSQLFVLGFAGLILACIFVECFFNLRRGRRTGDDIKAGVIPVGVLGAYLLVTSLFGQFLWPLPGSYNILFYDMLSIAGLLIIAFAWAVRRDEKTHTVGLFGLLSGLVAIYYGYEGYLLNLTQSPLAMFGLYALFGIAGVLSYPVTLSMDMVAGGAKKLESKWMAIGAIFVIALVLGSIIAIGTAALALPAHLASPP